MRFRPEIVVAPRFRMRPHRLKRVGAAVYEQVMKLSGHFGRGLSLEVHRCAPLLCIRHALHSSKNPFGVQALNGRGLLASAFSPNVWHSPSNSSSRNPPKRPSIGKASE